MKHRFKLVEPMGGGDHNFYYYECENCLQDLRIHKTFLQWIILTGSKMSPFHIRQLNKNMVRCNPTRQTIVIDLPVIPNCTVCQKRYVFEPGSKGIGGALCLSCYYDL